MNCKYLEATVVEVFCEENGKKLAHILGDSYWGDTEDEDGYRFVQYAFACISLKELVANGMPDGDWYAQFKQHVENCTEERLVDIYEHYDNGEMPQVITDITEDLPCGCYILMPPSRDKKKIEKICVTDIKWDAPKSAGLPENVTIFVSPGMEYLLDDIYGAAESLSDYLSDAYEHCHKGFAVTCE